MNDWSARNLAITFVRNQPAESSVKKGEHIENTQWVLEMISACDIKKRSLGKLGQAIISYSSMM